MTTETKAKHTPGPWKVQGNSIVTNTPRPEGCYCDVIIAETPHCYEPKDHIWPVIAANARLIAAAPDLLAALKHIADLIGVPNDDESKAISETARKAIAKAEGN